MSLTQTQIDEAFAAMGLPAPSAALLASMMAIPDTYDALNAIIELPQVQTAVIPIVSMFDLALGHDPSVGDPVLDGVGRRVSGGDGIGIRRIAVVCQRV